MGRRALLFTTLVTGVSFTSKANVSFENTYQPRRPWVSESVSTFALQAHVFFQQTCGAVLTDFQAVEVERANSKCGMMLLL